MVNEQAINSRIGQNIKKYRLLYNENVGKMTQKDLAEKIGTSVSMIGCLESSNLNLGISIYNLYKISEALGVSIDKFFEK